MRNLGLVIVALLLCLPGLTGCAPQPPEDAYACTPGEPSTCPVGWFCRWSRAGQEHRCFSSDAAPDASVDASVLPDGAVDASVDSAVDAEPDAAPCLDNDGDGRGPDCPLGPDACDGDAYNWTASGCADCSDGDNDGVRGTGCDLAEDCDDTAPGVVVPCLANGCPEGWILVPDGVFPMGCNVSELGDACSPLDEEPRHAVNLTAFCIQETEVSVAAYRECMDSSVCSGSPQVTSNNFRCNWSVSPASRESHPLNCVNWTHARWYCQDWLGGDLPTEAQWEKAARGTDQRIFPWGDTPDPDCQHCNWDPNDNNRGCYGPPGGPMTWEVGFLTGPEGDSFYGVKDMAGNVREWVRDWYIRHFYTECLSGCIDPVCTDDACQLRGVRGGSFFNGGTGGGLRALDRDSQAPQARIADLGLRCVRLP